MRLKYNIFFKFERTPLNYNNPLGQVQVYYIKNLKVKLLSCESFSLEVDDLLLIKEKLFKVYIN